MIRFGGRVPQTWGVSTLLRECPQPLSYWAIATTTPIATTRRSSVDIRHRHGQGRTTRRQMHFLYPDPQLLLLQEPPLACLLQQSLHLTMPIHPASEPGQHVCSHQPFSLLHTPSAYCWFLAGERQTAPAPHCVEGQIGDGPQGPWRQLPVWAYPSSLNTVPAIPTLSPTENAAVPSVRSARRRVMAELIELVTLSRTSCWFDTFLVAS
jgi:hypothetical protein